MKSIIKKLSQLRLYAINETFSKSGNNSFAGFKYLELQDFLPKITPKCIELGLFTMMTFDKDVCIFQVYDSETGDVLEFTSPWVMATPGKGQEIQGLGATHTYMRRYMWFLALDMVVPDEVDGTPQTSKQQAKKPSVDPAKAEAEKAIELVVDVATYNEAKMLVDSARSSGYAVYKALENKLKQRVAEIKAEIKLEV